MWSALILVLLGLGILAAGFLLGRFYIPDNRELIARAKRGDTYVKAVTHLADDDVDAAVEELLDVVRKQNVPELEPYYALGALFRRRGEWNRAIRVHQTLSIRDKKQRLRTLYELGLDYRAAGMPKLAGKVMAECVAKNARHAGALIALCHIFEEQGRYADAADSWRRLHKLQGGEPPMDERVHRHHLLVAAAQRASDASDWDSAKRLLREAKKTDVPSAHVLVASAELAMARHNPKGASAQLEQALAVAPEYARYLVTGLLAAQRQLIQAQLDKERAKEQRKSGSQRAVTEPADDVQAPDTEHGAEIDALEVELDERAARAAVEIFERILGKIGRNGHIEMALAELRSFYDPVQALDNYHRIADEFEAFLPARVAAGRLALASREPDDMQEALRALSAADGALSWAMDGSWRCGRCGQRADGFFWRCTPCRAWGRARLDIGRDVLDTPPLPKPRRDVVRGSVSMALLGAAAENALPAPVLDSGLSDEELHRVSRRPSVLGRVGSWFSGAISSLRKGGDKQPQISVSALPTRMADDVPSRARQTPPRVTMQGEAAPLELSSAPEMDRLALPSPSPEPEAPAPEAREPEAPAPAPEAREPEARAPEAREPEAREPEAREPAPAPEAREPEAPEASAPEASAPSVVAKANADSEVASASDADGEAKPPANA